MLRIRKEKNLHNMENKENLVKIKVIKNGPVKIETGCIITMPDGTEVIKEKRASFCTCGISETMPFCDGKHKELPQWEGKK